MTALGRQVAFPNINLNHIRTEDLPKLGQGVNELLLRPWQTLQGAQPQIQIMTPNWGISNAWLGTFKAEKRYQSGFGFTLAYTFTSWVDNLIPTGGGDSTFGDNDQIQNIYDLANERSASTLSIPHRVVLAPIYDLPFGHGRKIGSDCHPVLNAIAGGWQVSSIGTLRNGGYFGMAVLNGARDILEDSAAGRNLRPSFAPGMSGTGDIYAADKGKALSNGNRGISWLNPHAFISPGKYTFGNTSRTPPGIRGPASFLFQFMLAKNFNWAEKYRLQFRWEMFNMFNTPQFGLPGQTVGGGGLGEINGATFERRIMQVGLKLYF